MTPALEARSIRKSFGGVTALIDVSMVVAPGETVGLIGPNGAGKTTLFDCLSGVQRPDGGRVSMAGRDVTHLPVHRRARLGLGRTFQRVELFPGLTVRQHLLLAERVRTGEGGLWGDLRGQGLASRSEQATVEAMIGLVGLDGAADALVESLDLGHRRLVELARALVGRPTVLLLDEPSSGLDHVETQAMVATLDAVRRERGTAVVLVEHDLDMVTTVAERLYVLDHGVVIAHGEPERVFAEPGVRTAYLGASA
ncbi:MAG TPA: ABC transporter ATP-binding protein [Acidimicrobiia bacterium]|nr:ABC transporter ATP-binding protein [Acidimicrobiia bacterium]